MRKVAKWYRAQPYWRRRVIDYAIYGAVGAAMLAFIGALAKYATYEQGQTAFDWLRVVVAAAVGFGYGVKGTPGRERTRVFWGAWGVLLTVFLGAAGYGVIQGSEWVRMPVWFVVPGILVTVEVGTRFALRWFGRGETISRPRSSG
ncbi:MAG: hypothetical protein HY821_06015 [Acidobacteria bacterium]|nr:hypothetical protein [Acidobacteriota bacterium]